MKKTFVAYHGTNIDFDEFVFVGTRLTSMGLGYYFSPNKEKARQYGNILKKYKISGNFFDWNNIGDDFKEIIFPLLKEIAGDDIMAGYSSQKTKKFNKDKDGLLSAKAFYNKKKEETKNRHHDRSKARVECDNENYIITWRDADDLSDANNQMIMNLCQKYIHEIIATLGYDGAFYSSEIVVYNKHCIEPLGKEFSYENDLN